MRTLIATIVFFGSIATARAALETSSPTPSPTPTFRCDFDGIYSIKLPVYPDRSDSPTVDHKYQVYGDITGSAIPIVWLPGGPGSSSLDNLSSADVRAFYVRIGLPASQPWIFFDPRTAGCNDGDESVYPDDSLKSEYLADDVLAVLKHLGVRKYIILGHSYGSQWATFVAARAQESGGPVPMALVLSGVMGLGKADGTFAIPYQLAMEWKLLKSRLSKEAQEKLNVDNPLGYDAKAWQKVIQGGIYGGFLFHPTLKRLVHAFFDRLVGLEPDQPDALKSLVSALEATKMAPKSIIQNKFSRRLFNKVDCHEYSPADGKVIFSKGEIIPDPADTTCQGEAFDRPYDSAKLQSEVPIYYLSGTNDPAAPYEGAYYHFQNQKHSRRNFIRVPGGGHGIIGGIFPDCKDQLWNAIFKLEDFTVPLRDCKAEVELEVLPAG